MKKIVLLGCNDKTRAIVPILCKDASIASEICIASRDKSKCDEIRLKYQGSPVRISTARVDLNNESGTRMMLSIAQPDMLVNLTEASFSPIIMKLCLEIGVPYVDGTLFDIGAGDLLSKQFEFFGDFRKKNLTAVVGCDFNPAGITTLVRSSMEDDFDSIDSADIVEMAPKTVAKKMSIKELVEFTDEGESSLSASYIEDGKRVDLEDSTIKVVCKLPDNEEQTFWGKDNIIVEDFLKELPDVPTVRYYSTAVDNKPDTSILDELSKFGLLSKKPIEIEGVKIAPLDFISKLLENYDSDAPKNSEKSAHKADKYGMGIILSGKKNGEPKTSMIYIKDVAKCNAYAVIAGIRSVANKKWNRAGVFTPCAFKPSIMLESMKRDGFSYEMFDIAPIEVIKEGN
ncbi:MAG: saccharopine dehydrogenase NADP-binding domain-containing protein [Saccharofermentans sp.]|nr:saccharopine dehydrogenase NADP-binding domain-containing protein [Saccharofermentans sp.]